MNLSTQWELLYRDMNDSYRVILNYIINLGLDAENPVRNIIQYQTKLILCLWNLTVNDVVLSGHVLIETLIESKRDFSFTCDFW